MVKAYVHFRDPVDPEALGALFAPEDAVTITPAFDSAFTICSEVLKPLELRDIILRAALCEDLYFAVATRIECYEYFRGDPPADPSVKP